MSGPKGGTGIHFVPNSGKPLQGVGVPIYILVLTPTYTGSCSVTLRAWTARCSAHLPCEPQR